MFGGWRTAVAFTIGYGLPLCRSVQDYLFQSVGRRFLNISFGCSMDEVVVEKLIAKVILPEGSKEISVSIPFPARQSEETKFSHLDLVGRPVVVLQNNYAVPEHDQPFQVYYKFSNFSPLREPLMLISGIFFLFITCIIHVHADLTISKSSPSYIAKLQWDEVQAAVQQVGNIICQSLVIHNKLEGSLRELSITGEIQTCKSTRKAVENSVKELSKELKPLLTFLQSSPQASRILLKVEGLVSKERDLQERLMFKHLTMVESFERKSGRRDGESRTVSIQQNISVLQKISMLGQEVDELLDFIDEI